MFPDADDLLRYLKDYEQKLGVKIQFNTTVTNIRKTPEVDGTTGHSDLTYFDDQHSNTYSCK
jgi:hypothetical protein